MRLIHIRFSSRVFASRVATLAVLLVLAACSDEPFAPEVIEDATFAGSLNIDLAAMTRTASGLYVQTLVEGTGDPAAVGDFVSVGYAGFLSDGTPFDSGVFPFTLGQGQAVDGFDEGVRGMKIGESRVIVMPPSLAYGDTARGSIPAGSILVFFLELNSIG